MQRDDATDPTLDALVPSTDGDIRATVFVHSLAPVPCKESQDRLVADLATLDDRDVLTDIDLLVWGKSICTGSPLTEFGGGQRIIDAISEFYDLSAESELSVAPFFSISTVTTEYSESAFSRIVPPQRAVALYDGPELAAVFPCVADDTAYMPADAVAYLKETPVGKPTPIDESV